MNNTVETEFVLWLRSKCQYHRRQGYKCQQQDCLWEFNNLQEAYDFWKIDQFFDQFLVKDDNGNVIL